MVLFDLAGTTVRDGQPGTSLVVAALCTTLESAGVHVQPDAIMVHRGKDKRDTIRELLRENGAHVSDAEVGTLLNRFSGLLEAALSEFTEIPGTTETFAFLHERGIRVGVGSGFPQELVDRLVTRFQWQKRGLIDYAASTETTGAGRPDPRMIQQAMARFQIRDSRAVLKVGDTVVDIEEGKNAGAWTAAVLSGTQSGETLQAAGPDFILGSVFELPILFQ
jgi:phosphonatase-like hydrolase